jgi:PTH1 family peptidyl-tRNA hydrolase
MGAPIRSQSPIGGDARAGRLRFDGVRMDDPGMPVRGRFSEFRDASVPRAPAVREEPPTDHASGEIVRPVLVMGLGNPDREYASTRHNVGAWCVQLLARRHHVVLQRQGRVDRAEIAVDGHRIAIARPRSYMNESGPPVAAEVRRLRIDPSQLVVIYDELDLPVGRTRMRLQGGHGGNNGMRSLIAALGTTEFPRIRIGIDRPYDDGRPVRDPDRVADWVLTPPSAGDRQALEAAVEAVAEAVEDAAREGLEAAMSALNARE